MQPNDGRKIPRHLENPFDNMFIDASTFINRHLSLLHPNHLTTASLLTGLLAAYVIYHASSPAHTIVAATLVAVSYLLDCMDGNHARMYDRVTVFGDWYDHLSDISKYTLIYTAVAVSSLPYSCKVAFFTTIALMLTTYVHLGCQEKVYPKASPDSLSILEPICPEPAYITTTRYFGMGTWVVSMVLVLVLVPTFCLGDPRTRGK